MTPGVARLRDIHGLDSMSWWPPAAGWWLVTLALILVAVGLRYAWLWWRRRLALNWRSDAARQLRALRERLQWGDIREVASALSELMRRIAIARVGRRACAGLVDQDWVTWLETHDPQGFRWTEQGRLLTELPYAPRRARRAATELEPLVAAAEEWTRIEEPPRTAEGRWEWAERWLKPRWGADASRAVGEAHV
jgi:hypothetical protein